MTEGNFRKPNALKHGAFSALALMPWEDPTELEDLRRRVFDELQPDGPLQEDAVNSIVSAMWRKQRLRDKRKFDTAAELERAYNRILWEEPRPFFETKGEGIIHVLSNRPARTPASPQPGRPASPRDDHQQLVGFSSRLYGDTAAGIIKLSIKMLPPEFSKHLEEKVPADNFDTNIEWAFALKSEVDNVLLPMVRAREPQSDGYAAAASEFLNEDRFLEDLAIEERLDAHIERNLKRLYQLKMGRQLHWKPQPKTVDAKKINQIENNAAQQAEGS